MRERWTHLGHTVLYGEYEQARGTGSVALSDTSVMGNATESASRLWGLGAVQEIDAAAMSIWLSYRHLSFDNNQAGQSFEEFQYVKGGALINF